MHAEAHPFRNLLALLQTVLCGQIVAIKSVLAHIMPQKRKHVECAASLTGSVSKRIKYGATQLPAKEVSALTSRRWRRPRLKSKPRSTSKHCETTRAEREECTSGQRNKDTSTKRKSLQKSVDMTFKTRLDFPARPLVNVPDQPTCVSKDSHRMQVDQYASHEKPRLKAEFPKEITTYIRNEYQYSPIITGQIRLLILHPGSFDEDIQGDLITVDVHTSLQYEAVSYMWGNCTLDETIMISTGHKKPIYSHRLEGIPTDSAQKGSQHWKPKSIRSNLHQALKALRFCDQPRYLWIDALCIDQSTVQEKNQQVRMMGEIYSRAHNVCIWLGNDGAEPTSLNVPSHVMADVSMETIQDVLDPGKYENMLTDDTHMWKWVSLLNLMNRSWFRRAWIIQEIALAKRATIYCGTYTVDWMDFQDAVALFAKSFDILQPKLKAHFAEIQSDTKHWMTHPDFDVRRLAATRMVDALSALRKNDDGSLNRTKNLESLLCLFQDRVCSDPRDRVYALLSLATDGASIDVDYSKSVFEVHKEVVQRSVRATQSLDILCRPWAAGCTDAQSELTNLPSWIIARGDRGNMFDQISDQFTGGYMASETLVGIGENVPYSASGRGKYSKAPIVEFPGTTIVHGKIVQSIHLLARGIEIGRVTFCTEAMADRIIPNVVFRKLGGLCGERSTGGSKVPDRLWRTLVADRGPNNAPCPPWYRRTAQHCLNDLLCNGHLNIDRAMYSMSTYGADFLKRVRSVISNRVFFEAMATGYQHTKAVETLVGLGINGTREGDVLAILYGCSVPVVLRPVHEANGSTEYQLIGEAFIYGRMEGETFHSSYTAKTFRLV